MTNETRNKRKMNKLKEILLEEGTPLIPFGFASDKLKKYWGITPNNKHRLNAIRRAVTNAVISVAIPTYILGGLYSGAIEQREIQKEQGRIQEQQERADYLREQIYKADENGYGFLDLNEFYNYSLRMEEKNE